MSVITIEENKYRVFRVMKDKVCVNNLYYITVLY